LEGKAEPKPCMEINSSITSDPYELIYPFFSPADFIDLIMSKSLFLLVPIALIMLTAGIYRIQLKTEKLPQCVKEVASNPE